MTTRREHPALTQARRDAKLPQRPPAWEMDRPLQQSRLPVVLEGQLPLFGADANTPSPAHLEEPPLAAQA